MSIAFLATGEEIINGDTLNTNSQKMARALSEEGFEVGRHLACGDALSDLTQSIEFLSQTHDTIIITGGLGPTSDDRTRFALAQCYHLHLIEHPQAIEHVQSILTRASLVMNEDNRQQAFFPKDATLMANPYGTAMGAFIETKKKFFLLPGPPRECLPMFNQFVLPALLKEPPGHVQILKWRLFGVAESEIGTKLDKALAELDCETGYRLEVPYVEFKVRCDEALVEKVRTVIDPLVGPYIISPPEYRASEHLKDRINGLPLKIEILDDVTGGVLQRTLQEPSNVKKLAFHETPDFEMHFHLKGLEAYWQGEKSNSTQVSIHVRCQDFSEVEAHTLPYRSPLVIDYAAEWLSYRILHLINQFHQSIA